MSEGPSPSSANTSRDNWLRTACLILGGTALFYFGRPEFPAPNSIFHVPFVLDYGGSTDGPHDAFTASLSRFVSLFWLCVRFIATEENLTALFFAISLFGYITTLGGLYALGRATAANASWMMTLGVLTMAAIPALGHPSPFGGAEMLGRSPNHSQVATGLCLLGIAAALSSRWVLAAAVLGAAANVNLFLALWTFGAVAAFQLLADDDGFSLSRIGKPLITFVALALPVFAWILTLPSVQAPDFSFRAFLSEYYPYHSFLHVQWKQAIQFVCVATSAAALVLSAAENRKLRKLALFLLVGVGLLTAGAILMYLTDQAYVLNLYPLRQVGILTLVLGVLLAGLWIDGCRHERRGIFGLIALLGLAAGDGVWTTFSLGLLALWGNASKEVRIFCWTAFFLALLTQPPSTVGLASIAALTIVSVVSIQAGLSREKIKFRAVLIGIYISLGLNSALKGDRPAIQLYELFSSSEFVAGLATWLAALFFFTTKPWPKQTSIAASIIITACLAGLVSAYRTSFGFSNSNARKSFVSAQHWARQNTLRTAKFHMFGLPFEGFTTFSRRSVWWEWKTGAATMWDPAFYKEWSRRRSIAGRIENDVHANILLARCEGLSYVVTGTRFETALKRTGAVIVYRNPHLVIANVMPNQSSPGYRCPTELGTRTAGPSPALHTDSGLRPRVR